MDNILYLPELILRVFMCILHRHVLLRSSSYTYFGLEWDGVYLVFCTLPFGWKASASPSRVLPEAVNLLVLVNRNGLLQQWFVSLVFFVIPFAKS